MVTVQVSTVHKYVLCSLRRSAEPRCPIRCRCRCWCRVQVHIKKLTQRRRNTGRTWWYVSSEVFFKIKLNVFLGTLILNIFFQIIEINNFRGDLSDTSAKISSLYMFITFLTPDLTGLNSHTCAYMIMMYLSTTVPHPHGHWQLHKLLGNVNAGLALRQRQ